MIPQETCSIFLKQSSLDLAKKHDGRNAVVRVSNISNFKCFRQIFTALNCEYIGTSTFFLLATCDLRYLVKAMPFEVFEDSRFSLKSNFTYQEM